MWTEITRPNYERKGAGYSSDLSDAEWAMIEPRLPQRNRLLMGGRGPMRWIRSASDIGYLTRYAERLWPRLKGVTWTHGWNSRLAITADHYPHVHEPAEDLLARRRGIGADQLRAVAASPPSGGTRAKPLSWRDR